MRCKRPLCEDDEHRIDGYCSLYCRDVHELELVIADVKGVLSAAALALEFASDPPRYSEDNFKAACAAAETVAGKLRDAAALLS